MSSSNPREEGIFNEALAYEGEERDRYLDKACGEDAPLRERVQDLLRASGQADDYLEPKSVAAIGPG
jgi:hypothetical protein